MTAHRKIIPNLFLVGWPKTGSTSVDYYLSQHPNVYMATVKESYFHARDIINSSKLFDAENKFPYKDDESYQALFDKYKGEKVIGESSVFYIISEVALDEIKSYNPDAKIVCLIRNPTELVASWHHYLRFRGRENTSDVIEAIKLQDERKSLKKLPPVLKAPIHFQYDEIADIKKHYNKLFSIFEKENIFVILYDELKANEEKIVKYLYRFLDVDYAFTPDFTHRNRSARIKHQRIKSLLDANKGFVVRVLKRLRLVKKNKGLHKLYSKFFTENKKRQSLNSSQEDYLNDRYAEQIDFYSQLKQKHTILNNH